MNVKCLSFFIIFLVFVLLIVGAIVHNTGSSLACPDWPLCYGQFFPTMKGGVLFEHGHRLLGALVGFLTLLLVYSSWRTKKISPSHAKIFNYCVLALGLVLLQGLLGGLTVIYKLPTLISTSHLSLAMFYFLLIIFIHHMSSRVDKDERIPVLQKKYRPILRHGVLFSLALFYSQMILGAFMRHVGAGTACGSGWQNTVRCFDIIFWKRFWIPESAQAQLHMFHRLWAVIITPVIYYFIGKIFLFFLKKRPCDKVLLFLPIFIIFLVAIQILLGLFIVSENLNILPTTLHLAVAALCLGSIWKYNLILLEYEGRLGFDKSHSFFSDILNLMKPKLSFSVTATVLVGILLAERSMNFFSAVLALVLIGMVVVGGTSLNCFLEREIDSKMERTKGRPLPSGRIRPKTVLIFGIALVLFSLPMIFYMINVLTGSLALVALLSYLYAYTPLKKKSLSAVFVGAIPGGLPPLMGITASMGTVNQLGLTLFVILYVWQIPHFMAISIHHLEDYKKAEIKIFPIDLGFMQTRWIIIFFTGMLLVISLYPYYFDKMGVPYLISAILLGLYLLGVSLRSPASSKSDWGRGYFLASIIYLPLLLASMIYFL